MTCMEDTLSDTLKAPGLDKLGPIAAADAAEALARLQRSARTHQAGTTILQEGDESGRVFLVFDGWLSTSKSLENGEVQIIDFILPGDFVEPVSADGATTGITLSAVTDAHVATLTQAQWHDLLQDSPGFAAAVDHLRAAAQMRISERLLRIGKGSAPTRVAYALLELVVRLHTIDKPSTHLPLGQKDIGDFTGLSSVHVCRTMRRMVRHGVIETSDHLDLRILDLGELTHIAGIEPERLAREISPQAA